jgi:hypothetical protein
MESEPKHPSLLGPEWPWNLASECLLPLKARPATLPSGISLVLPQGSRVLYNIGVRSAWMGGGVGWPRASALEGSRLSPCQCTRPHAEASAGGN